jgi:WD40 repeat protein
MPSPAIARLGSDPFLHDGSLSAITFLPDQAHIATFVDGLAWKNANHIVIWNPVDGTRVTTLRTPALLGFDRIGISPDGHFLAAMVAPTIIGVWDLLAKTRLREFDCSKLGYTRAFHLQVRRLALSNDGVLLALANPRNEVHVVDAERGIQVATLSTAEDLVFLQFHSKGDFLVGSTTESVFVWDLRSHRLRWTHKVGRNIVSATLANDGTRLGVIEELGAFSILAIDDGTTLTKRAVPGVKIKAAVFSANLQRIALTKYSSPDLYLVDVDSTRSAVQIQSSIRSPSPAFRFDPRGEYLLHVEDARARIHRVRDAKDMFPRVGNREVIEDISFSADDLFLGAADGQIACLWNTSKKLLSTQVLTASKVTCVCSVAKEACLVVPHAEVDARKDRFRGGPNNVRTLGIPDSIKAITATNDGVVHVVDSELRLYHFQNGVKNDVIRVTLPPDRQMNGELALSLDGSMVACGGLNRDPHASSYRDVEVFVFDACNARVLYRVRVGMSSVNALSLSPDKRLIAACGEARVGETTVGVWEVVSGKLLCVVRLPKGLPVGCPKSVAISPDSRVLAFAYDKSVGVHEIISSQRICELAGHVQDTTCVVFSRHGGLLASGDAGGAIILWDVAKFGARDEVRTAESMKERQRRLWAELAGSAAEGYKAIDELSRWPVGAVQMIDDLVKPVQVVDVAKIRSIVANLDSELFATREAASRKIESFGRADAIAFLGLASEKDSAELSARVEILRRRVALAMPDFLREMRAVQVLERIRTDASVGLLEKYARGEASHPLTISSKEALRRINKENGTK